MAAGRAVGRRARLDVRVGARDRRTARARRQRRATLAVHRHRDRRPRRELSAPTPCPLGPPTAAAQREALRAGGIVGLGGAVYPTADKLATPVPCKTLIVNGAECEPYISCDDMLMRENAAEIVAGALLLTDVLEAPRCIIAIERDKPQAMEAIEDAARAIEDPRLKLAEVPTIYPAGGEKQLVELLTGEEVPSGRYPERVRLRLPERRHRLRGAAPARGARAAHRRASSPLPAAAFARRRTSKRRSARRSQSSSHYAAATTDGVVRLIAGGSMMGYALPDDDMPITQGDELHHRGHRRRSQDSIPTSGRASAAATARWCARRGCCRRTCSWRPRRPTSTRSRTLGLQDCIECGCCDVICPSQIMLTERFRIAKRAIAARERVRVTTPGQE